MTKALLVLMLLLPRLAQATTYYIDATGGADTNNGTAKGTPWAHVKGMTACASNCSAHTPVAGDSFIFKGGVTWTGQKVVVSWNGSAGNVITYGVDQTWYTGGSWTRPILDGNYAVDILFDVWDISYVTIDGLELSHVTSTLYDYYGQIRGSGTGSHHITMNNLYIHGWRTTNAQDESHGGVWFGYNYNANIDTIVINNSEIENSENIGQASWGGGNGTAVRSVGTIYNTVIHDVSSAVVYCLDFDHSTMYNIAMPGNGPGPMNHSNGVYLDPYALGKSVGYIRNSLFHDNDQGSNFAYPNCRFSTCYVYNNVFYGANATASVVSIDPYDYGAGATSGTYYVYNNTVYITDATGYKGLVQITDRLPAEPSSVVVRNNHIIGTSVTVGATGPAASYTASNQLIQTYAAASAQGYTTANLFQPISSSGSTYNAGFDGSALFTVDKLGVTRPQTTTWDIGAYEFSSVCTPDHLTFTDQPSSALITASLGTVVVEIKDSSGTTCTDQTTTITLSKNGSATWGTLTSSSSLAKAATAGVSTWTDLSVTTTTGTGSMDAAASGVTSATSSSFNISATAHAGRRKLHK